MEFGKILSIEEVSFGNPEDGWPGQYEGYEVRCEHLTILFGLESGQCCCEEYGYLATDDDLASHVGEYLVAVKKVDEVLSSKFYTKKGSAFDVDELFIDEGGFAFLEFVTRDSTFQLVAYNAHNGYYGHDAICIIGRDVLFSETL